MKLATAFVEVRPDTKAFKADLQRQTESDARSVGKALGSAFAGGAFLAGAKRAIDAASDLNEAANVTKITFGAAEQQVADFAKTAATAIGQSEAAARAATATFGGLLLNLGFTEKAAADTSISLTKLASDLGSAFNTDPAEAALALSSALRGEQEPILKYNVLLSDVAVRQEAVRLGLADTAATADDSAKVQARLSLIMEQTSRVQGDFANTATGAANAQRIAAAQAEDAAADLGDNLIPIYERVVAVVGEVAEVFGSLPEPVQTAIIALAGIAALSGPTRAAFEAIGALATIARTRLPQALNAAATGAYDLAGGLDRVKGRAISTGIELGLLAAAIALTNEQASHADISKLENALLDLAQGSGVGGEAASALGKDLGDLASAIELVAAPSVVSQIENFSGALNRALGDTDDDLSNARATIDDLDAALASLATRDPEAAAAALQAILGNLSDDAAARLPDLLDDYSSSLANVDTAQRTAGGSAAGLAGNLTGTEQAAKDAAASVDLYRSAVEKALRPLTLQDAKDRRTQDLLDLADGVDQRARAVEDARQRIADLQASQQERGISNARAIEDAERHLAEARANLADADNADAERAEAAAKRANEDRIEAEAKRSQAISDAEHALADVRAHVAATGSEDSAKLIADAERALKLAQAPVVLPIRPTESRDADERANKVKAVEDAERSLARVREDAARDTGFERDMAQAQEDLQDAIDDTSLALDGETEAALRNREMLRQLVQDGVDVITQARDQGVALDDLEVIRDNERESLRRTLTQLGFNQQAVDEYVAVLDAIPLTKATTLTLEAAEAIENAKGYLAVLLALDEVVGGDARLRLNASIGARDHALMTATAHAAGGSVMDGLFTVGEHGTELLRKSGSSVDVIAGSPSAVFDGVGEDQLLTQREMVALLRGILAAVNGSGIEAMRGLQLELT